jgi:hypothetical protein
MHRPYKYNDNRPNDNRPNIMNGPCVFGFDCDAPNVYIESDNWREAMQWQMT